MNGQTYTENLADISGTGYSGGTSCTNKPGFLQFSGMIETSQLLFEAYLFHHENDIDFGNPNSSAARLMGINNFSPFSGNSCSSNFDFVIDYNDKLLSNQACFVESTGKTHTIESIKLLGTTSTEKVYAITGSFSCTIRNSNNVAIPLTGKYRTTVRTLR